MTMLVEMLSSLTLVEAFQQVFYAVVVGFLGWIVAQGCKFYRQACRVVLLLENAERHHKVMARQFERMAGVQTAMLEAMHEKKE